MNSVVFAGLLLCSFVALVACSTDAIYGPSEYELAPYEEVRSVRAKRHLDPASLAFLGGVAAGGIFGPLLYNKLYGNQYAGGYSYSTPSVSYGGGDQGWN